jgi:hypothetical protein
MVVPVILFILILFFIVGVAISATSQTNEDEQMYDEIAKKEVARARATGPSQN